MELNERGALFALLLWCCGGGAMAFSSSRAMFQRIVRLSERTVGPGYELKIKDIMSGVQKQVLKQPGLIQIETLVDTEDPNKCVLAPLRVCDSPLCPPTPRTQTCGQCVPRVAVPVCVAAAWRRCLAPPPSVAQLSLLRMLFGRPCPCRLLVMTEWSSKKDLQAWLASPLCKEVSTRLADVLDRPPEYKEFRSAEEDIFLL